MNFDPNWCNLPAFFLAAAAAFVIINDYFVMVDVVFFCVIFEVRDNFITTKKKIFFEILREKIFSDTNARKDLLCHCEKRSFVPVTYNILNSYVYRIHLQKFGKTQLQLSYTTNISFSTLSLQP